jgi:hypothetical protein
LVASSHTGILYVAWGCFQKFKKLENYPPPRCASQDSEPQAAPPQFALARLSVQEQEGKQADYNSAAARVNAAAAEVAADQGEVDRLQALESFKRIVAPFDGVEPRAKRISAVIQRHAEGFERCLLLHQ